LPSDEINCFPPLRTAVFLQFVACLPVVAEVRENPGLFIRIRASNELWSLVPM
jgi:hypothetical protein